MGRPQIADIEHPSLDTPMADFAERACGQSYAVAFRARNRYRGVGRWELDVPARKDDQGDWPNVVEPNIQAAQDLLDGNNAALPVSVGKEFGDPRPGVQMVVDPRNSEAIQHLIDRARAYADAAKVLLNYWASEWQPRVVSMVEPADAAVDVAQAEMPHWPLGKALAEAIPLCAAGTQQVEWSGLTQGIPWKALVACPDEETVRLHEKDSLLIASLHYAAKLWARCAEEAAAIVGLHHLNKREWETQQREQRARIPGTFIPQATPPGITIGEEPGEGLSPLPGNGDTPPLYGEIPGSAEETPAKTGVSTPVKVIAIGAGLYLAYRLLA